MIRFLTCMLRFENGYRCSGPNRCAQPGSPNDETAACKFGGMSDRSVIRWSRQGSFVSMPAQVHTGVGQLLSVHLYEMRWTWKKLVRDGAATL